MRKSILSFLLFISLQGICQQKITDEQINLQIKSLDEQLSLSSKQKTRLIKKFEKLNSHKKKHKGYNEIVLSILNKGQKNTFKKNNQPFGTAITNGSDKKTNRKPRKYEKKYLLDD